MKFSNNKLKKLELEIKKQQRVIKRQNREYEKLLKKIQTDKLKAEKRRLKELKREQDNKHRVLQKEFKKMVAKDNAKLKRQNKKIEKLENIVDIGHSTMRIYFYVEKAKDIDGEYNKVYKFQNDNKIQYSLNGDKIYSLCLDCSVNVPNFFIKQYRKYQFYNKEDNGNEFIERFKKYVMSCDNDIEDTIDIIQVSRDIEGFKILSVDALNNNMYIEPDVLNTEVFLDGSHKGINNHYIKYKLNLEASNLKDLINVEFNDYLKVNFKPNCCLLTAIINKFYNRFNQKTSDGYRRNKELTYEYLCELLKLENKKSHIGCSIQHVVNNFFSKFNFLGLVVYDCYNRLIFEHKPTSNNTNRCVLRIMYKDKHVYELNDNLKSLEQKIDYSDDERDTIIVSNKYNIMKAIEEKLELFTDSYNGIVNAIKKHSLDENLKQLQIMTSCDINNILFDLIDSGYTPKVFFSSQLYKLCLKIENLYIQIIPNHNEQEKGQYVEFVNIDEYKKYTSEFNKFYDEIIKTEYISDSHESILIIDETYPIKPVMGYFDEFSNLSYTTIDENKAYTECLMSIEQIPKFSYFDVYKPYNNEPIENLTYYIIEVLENSKRASILFDAKICRTYGYILKQTDIKYKILQYRNPLNIEDVNFRLPVENLYKSDLEIAKRKAIANITIGLLEKKTNKGELSKIFDDYNEANYYSIKYDGKILKLSNDDIETNLVYCPIDEKMIETNTFKEQRNVYLVKIQDSKKLINGFTPIKDMIYLNQKIKLLKQYDELVKLGYDIKGIKTDCIFFQGSLNKLGDNIKLSNEIGEFKIEENKYLINKPIVLEDNKLIDIKDFSKLQITEFEDERDIPLMNEYITNNKNVLIKGLYPGVGKSTMCKDFDKKALFVCPYNKLCQNTRTENFDSITYCKLFGLIGTDKEMSFIKEYDLSNYKTIVFDEIFLYEPQRLKRISELMKKYPDKYFLATGDCDQRSPVGFNNSDYLTQCMNILFPNQVLLNEIKRFKNVDDRNRLIQIKKDIFNVKMSIETICKNNHIKTIKSIEECNTKLNIALFNFRCKRINNHVHKNILKLKDEFTVGQEIICTKYEKKKDYVINTNYTYKIVKLSKAYTTIIDEIEDLTYTIPNGVIFNNFKLPYCLTVDSVQGLSFGEDDKITIFDANTPYVDRKFFWTAITRARKLENVSVCIHSEAEIGNLSRSRIKQYFNFKVDSYKRQDKKVNREYNNDDYINEQWITEKVNDCKLYCCYCKKHMELYIDEDGNVQSNITVDRLNNKLAHIKSNCQITCLKCNLTKGNRY
jgi:hypothetical protein